jgi:hypothetical protein
MKNFTLILFILFILFLLFSLFIQDFLLIYLSIVLALIIGFICLNYYLNAWRGTILGLGFLILPFVMEYLGYKLNLPFFTTHLIKELTAKNLNIPITINNLFLLITVPLLFITSLFFGIKIKNSSSIKKFHSTFLVIVCSLLVAMNYLVITQAGIEYQEFIKWLIIALAVNIILSKIYIFEFGVSDLYKELPIIIFLAIYGSRALRSLDEFNLIISLFFALIYLYILYVEYKIKKINRQF